MKTAYIAKTLMTGYKLGLKSADIYVAVPAGKGFTHAIHNSKIMELKEIVKSKEFPDKFKVNEKYILNYYKWKGEED